MLATTPDGRTKLSAARDGAREFLEILRYDRPARAAIVLFHETAQLVQALTASKQELLAALGRLEVASGSRIHLGIGVGGEVLFGARRRTSAVPVLIVMTDGRSDPDPPELAVGAASDLRRRGVDIY